MPEPLDFFSRQISSWFTDSFSAPTQVQGQAWPAIASGDHVLISAPTGSGKTLAAFLWGLNQIATKPLADEDRRVRLLYVSPLKALSHDVERNLRAPLRGLQLRDPQIDIQIALRTGDTSQRERQAMRRHPPDVLITTPESLYLMLTSGAREILTGVESVIVDEIHAVAGSKRGSHLALTLERLSALRQQTSKQKQLTGSWTNDQIQRIGLSATQRPLDEIGRFLVGTSRQCTVIETDERKQLDLKILLPWGEDEVNTVRSKENRTTQIEQPDSKDEVNSEVSQETEPEFTLSDPFADYDELKPLRGGESLGANAIWPTIYPEILELVKQHRSTIVFVNSRRAAERLALRLNELAFEQSDHVAADSTSVADNSVVTEPAHQASPEGSKPIELARAHHGSLSREERKTIEELLKSGALPCLVATSSLELGIDMGAVDLVLQIESPKSVASGLQRIGRAGHGVGQTAKGRIFPKFKADLLECTVLVKRMREQQIEPTSVIHNALDVLAQQLVAIVASAGDDGLQIDELFSLVTAAYPYSQLPRTLFEHTLDMLDGRYPSQDFAQLKARVSWDRGAGIVRPRQGSLRLAIANAGTIPDRGLFRVTLPDGRRVGELDEEMVYEARAGQTFMLGASSWRIEEITRDTVIVTPAPGAPGQIPFWRGDQRGRPATLGKAIGEFSRQAVGSDPQKLADEYDLDLRGANQLLDFLSEQQEATGVVPSDRTLVVEAFRDEIGDWRHCLLSPYGGRVHSAWGLAVSRKIRNELGVEPDVIWSDDGIVMHLPDTDEKPDPQLFSLSPDEVESLIVDELGGSSLFGARFRENAGRSLLIPRAQPGRRTPLWQQRLKASSLLEVAEKFKDFPIILETYRECLKDVLDLPALIDVLTQIERSEIELVAVETQFASPMASALLFDYIATYMYEGDSPNAERRAAALSLDKDLLRELLGHEELRELIDPASLQAVEQQLQCLSEQRQAANADGLLDLLRRLGDLTESELVERCQQPLMVRDWLEQLERQYRAVKVRLGGEERWVAADDCGALRDGLGVPCPAGVPDEFQLEVNDPLQRIVRRYAETHGPFAAKQLAVRYGVDLTSVLRELERDGHLVQGQIRPDGTGIEWCSSEVLRRIRRASIAALRREIEPVPEQALAAFSPSWQGIDRYGSSGANVSRLEEALVPLQGLALTIEQWEQTVLPRRCGRYDPRWLDQLLSSGQLVWIGSQGKVAFYFRDDTDAIGPLANVQADQPSAAVHQLLVQQLLNGPQYISELLAGITERLDGTSSSAPDDDSAKVNVELPTAEQLTAALWELVWSGAVSCDSASILREVKAVEQLVRSGLQQVIASTSSTRAGAPELVTRSAIGRRRLRSRRSNVASVIGGRFSLTKGWFAGGGAQHGAEQRRTICELLLERNGIVTREHVKAAKIPGGFAALYDSFLMLETVGLCRRGYFVEGLGGAQFALPGAVERLRAIAEVEDSSLVIDVADPAQPYGSTIAWPDDLASAEMTSRQQSGAALPKPNRNSGSTLVLINQKPVLLLDRAGKSLQVFVSYESELLQTAFELLAKSAQQSAARQQLRGPIKLKKIDGLPVYGHRLTRLLEPAGFVAGVSSYTVRQ